MGIYADNNERQGIQSRSLNKILAANSYDNLHSGHGDDNFYQSTKELNPRNNKALGLVRSPENVQSRVKSSNQLPLVGKSDYQISNFSQKINVDNLSPEEIRDRNNTRLSSLEKVYRERLRDDIANFSETVKPKKNLMQYDNDLYRILN